MIASDIRYDDVGGSTDTRCSKVHFSWVLLRIVDKFFERFPGGIGSNNQSIPGRLSENQDGGEIVQSIGNISKMWNIKQPRRGTAQYVVPIRLFLGDQAICNRPTSSASIRDNDGLAKMLFGCGGHRPHGNVRRSAGRHSNDHIDRFCRELLGG
jgi:hypothetical protein